MKGVLLEVSVELLEFKSIRRISLVLRGGVIALAILGTYEADDFADFAFLGHDSNLLARRRAFVPKRNYGSKSPGFATRLGQGNNLTFKGNRFSTLLSVLRRIASRVFVGLDTLKKQDGFLIL